MSPELTKLLQGSLDYISDEEQNHSKEKQSKFLYLKCNYKLIVNSVVGKP